MNNRSIGGGDVGDPGSGTGQYGVSIQGSGTNTVGLLIKCWGVVTEKDADYLLISDGSGVIVRVDTTGMSSLPEVDDYVDVSGISSLYKPVSDRERLILARDRADIRP